VDGNDNSQYLMIAQTLPPLLIMGIIQFRSAYKNTKTRGGRWFSKILLLIVLGASAFAMAVAFGGIGNYRWFTSNEKLITAMMIVYAIVALTLFIWAMVATLKFVVKTESKLIKQTEQAGQQDKTDGNGNNDYHFSGDIHVVNYAPTNNYTEKRTSWISKYSEVDTLRFS